MLVWLTANKRKAKHAACSLGALLTRSIDRKVKILNVPKLTEDLLKVLLVDIFRQSFDHDLFLGQWAKHAWMT